MKTMNSLLIALAVTATSTALTYGQALSPRAEANRDRVVSSKATDPDLTKATAGVTASPRGMAEQTRIVAKAKNEGDTLAAIRNSTLSPKAQQQLGTSAQFEVAPLGKKSAKECDSGCCSKK